MLVQVKEEGIRFQIEATATQEENWFDDWLHFILARCIVLNHF